MLSFVTHTIRPWLVRIEQSIHASLIPPRDRRAYFAEHKVDGLLRGDIASRYTAFSVGRQWGWLSVNDMRRLENLYPFENGDVYLQPLNMAEAGQLPPAAPETEDGDAPADAGEERE